MFTCGGRSRVGCGQTGRWCRRRIRLIAGTALTISYTIRAQELQKHYSKSSLAAVLNSLLFARRCVTERKDKHIKYNYCEKKSPVGVVLGLAVGTLVGLAVVGVGEMVGTEVLGSWLGFTIYSRSKSAN